MKLEVHERLALLELLPSKGSYAGLKALRKAREIISPNQEEREFFELKHDGRQWSWNPAKASQRVLDAPIEQFVMETVREALAEMNANGEMTEAYMSLYEKFVIAYRTVEP